MATSLPADEEENISRCISDKIAGAGCRCANEPASIQYTDCQVRNSSDSKPEMHECDVVESRTSSGGGKASGVKHRFKRLIHRAGSKLKNKTTGNQCHTCNKHSSTVSHFCNDCDVTFCAPCVESHAQTCTPQCASDVPTKTGALHQKLDSLHERMKSEYVKQIKMLQDTQKEVKNAEEEKSKAIRLAAKVKHDCMADLFKFFNNIDSEIYKSSRENARILLNEEKLLQTNVQDMESQLRHFRQLDETAIENDIAFGVQLSRTAKEMMVSLTPQKHFADVAGVRVLAGRLWDASTAAILDVCSNKMTAPTVLYPVTGRKYTRQKDIRLHFSWFSIRRIKGQVWCCHNSGISIYDDDLNFIRSLNMGRPGEAMGVRDVTEISGGDLVVATDECMFSCQPNGDRLQILDSALHSNLTFCENQLFATNSQVSVISQYKFLFTEWEKCADLELPCTSRTNRHNISLTAANGKLFAMCLRESRMYITSLCGKILEVIDYHWSAVGDPRAWDSPIIWQADADGAVLVIEGGHVKVRDADGDISRVKLQPDINNARSVCIYGGKIYVCFLDRYIKLSVYIRDT